MNSRKLAMTSVLAVAAIGLAVWMGLKSNAPSLPDEPVAAGPQATHRSPDEPLPGEASGNH